MTSELNFRASHDMTESVLPAPKMCDTIAHLQFLLRVFRTQHSAKVLLILGHQKTFLGMQDAFRM